MPPYVTWTGKPRSVMERGGCDALACWACAVWCWHILLVMWPLCDLHSVISSSFNSISMVNIEDRSLFFFKERNIFCLHVAIKITLFTIEKKGWIDLKNIVYQMGVHGHRLIHTDIKLYKQHKPILYSKTISKYYYI